MKPGARDTASSAAVRAVDPNEVTVLMKRGHEFMAVGDVLPPGISFERAAEAAMLARQSHWVRRMILLRLLRSA
jgi:hypothetical protein